MLAGPGTARPRGVLAAIRDGNRLTAAERLDIYARGYRARLLEALQGEFTLLKTVIGEDAFILFATAYLADQPSTSYTLYDLGAGFADFLARHRPQAEGEALAVVAVPEALARIDRARAEVARARGVEKTGETAEGETSQGERPFLLSLVPSAPLTPQTCQRPDSLRLLALPVDAVAIAEAVEAGEPAPDPDLTLTCAAVARTGFRTRLQRLEPWQYAFLASRPAAPAPEFAHPIPEPPSIAAEPHDQARLTAWLPIALAQGWVAPGR